MKFIKHVALKVMGINGDLSPCECTETVTCAFCVQVNLMLMEKKLSQGDDIVKASIKAVKKNGIRKAARQIGEHEKTIRRWIQSGNIPQQAVEKLASMRT